jgi:hypothetical protein
MKGKIISPQHMNKKQLIKFHIPIKSLSKLHAEQLYLKIIKGKCTMSIARMILNGES